MNAGKKLLNNIDIKACLIVFLAGIMYFYLALHYPMNQAPDESMRYDIPKYIFEHNCLPIGDEEEIRNVGYGISYGYTPYLSSLISVVFMKIVSVFSTEDVILIAAARMSSVFLGIGTVIMCLKMGSLVFKEGNLRYLFAILVAFFPQFVFICSYLNNDTISVFATVLILYFWIYGIKNHWNIKSCTGLGIATGVSALAYYFGYAFILCSIFIFVSSILEDNTINKKGSFIIRRGLWIFFVALMVAGWFFIRNFMIHEGDFLGMRTSNEQSEIYAMNDWKPSNRSTYQNQGKTMFELLFESKWLVSTFLSYYAVFGNMSVRVSSFFYVVFIVFLLVGSIYFIKRWRNHRLENKLFVLIGMLACIITFFISIWYSYASDYQPQGRYIISTMPYVMLMMTLGYQELEEIFISRNEKYALILIEIVGIFWIILFLLIFIKFLNPLCLGIV